MTTTDTAQTVSTLEVPGGCIDVDVDKNRETICLRTFDNAQQTAHNFAVSPKLALALASNLLEQALWIDNKERRARQVHDILLSLEQ